MSTVNAPEPAQSAPPRAMERWWSSRLASGATFALGATLLECLPVAAALQLGAALLARDPGAAAVPLWALLTLTLAAALLGHLLRGQKAGTVLIAAAPCWAVSAALVVRLSPGGYGAVSDGLGALGHDLTSGGTRLNGVFALLLLVTYLWWRGLRLGQSPPHGERLAGVLRVGLGVIVVTIAAAATVPGVAGSLLVGRLGLLLPLEVFAGMACLALAQVAVQRRAEQGGAVPSAPAPWLGFALTLSGLVVAVAFVFTLVLSFDTLSGAVASLGPLGAALDAGLRWLIYGFSYAIFFVLGGVVNWVNANRAGVAPVRQPQQPAVNPHNCPTAACPYHLAPSQGIAVAVILAVLIVTVLAVLFFAVYRSLSALRRASDDDEDAWERRESLDVRALLGAQLRDMLAGLTPHAAPAPQLPEGSVRRLYEDVLAAADRAGHGRQPPETPDEYAPRLAARAGAAEAPTNEPHPAAEDVAALTAAYERVRYAGTPDAREDHPALRAAARRLIARLRER
jgi:hypothetical protein